MAGGQSTDSGRQDPPVGAAVRAEGRVPAFVAAHRDYSWTGDARNPGQPTLLVRPRIVHVVLVAAPGPIAPWFQNYTETGARWLALCGAEVLAVTPRFFDERAPGSCRRCGDVMNRWLDDLDGIRWDAQVHPPAGA